MARFNIKNMASEVGTMSNKMNCALVYEMLFELLVRVLKIRNLQSMEGNNEGVSMTCSSFYES